MNETVLNSLVNYLIAYRMVSLSFFIFTSIFVIKEG